MSRSQRDKGKRGESDARLVLQERDYEVIPMRCGEKSEDIIAKKDGVTYSVEVKHQVSIHPKRFRGQAINQCRPHHRWMVMAHVDGYKAFVVLFQGDRRVHVWNYGGEES